MLLTFRTRCLQASPFLLSQSDRDTLSGWRPSEIASSNIISHWLQKWGRQLMGGCGGMNPDRVSTSKSWAARVVVSGRPSGLPTRTFGRDRARKWVSLGCSIRGQVTVMLLIIWWQQIYKHTYNLAWAGSDLVNLSGCNVGYQEDSLDSNTWTHLRTSG